ncbi:type II CRISPR-associated endonuclease Cas1, partial [Pectobacterium atrosepticum]|nr:type II CRISPR-associated endonuclease Cas1 [Pectobacterium atrosepticum]
AGFSRSLDIPINAALIYGYSILLSAFNREIIVYGYITQLGIFHDNMFNPFNLGSDLMEPFRPLVDAEVFKLNPQKFEHEEKLKIVSVINKKVFINNKEHYINKAIEIFVHSIFDALNEKDISQIKFYRNEL